MEETLVPVEIVKTLGPRWVRQKPVIKGVNSEITPKSRVITLVNRVITLVNRVITLVNRVITLVNRVITLVNRVITLVNRVITLVNRVISLVNRAITLVNRVIILVNRVITLVNRVITLVNRVITLVKPIYFRPFIGGISPLKTVFLGPLCKRFSISTGAGFLPIWKISYNNPLVPGDLIRDLFIPYFGGLLAIPKTSQRIKGILATPPQSYPPQE